jgi:hypothetical protein
MMPCAPSSVAIVSDFGVISVATAAATTSEQ